MKRWDPGQRNVRDYKAASLAYEKISGEEYKCPCCYGKSVVLNEMIAKSGIQKWMINCIECGLQVSRLEKTTVKEVWKNMKFRKENTNGVN